MQVRKVLLKKYLPSPNAHEITSTPCDCTRWISLGHFDEIYTFSNIMSGGFDDILKSNNELLHINNEDSCFYPLYLIVSKTSKEEADFWAAQRWHIVITRIHFSCTDSPLTQFETLKNKISNDLGRCHLYQFYHTTELSDMVLVQKSNRLQDLLDIALTLRKYSQVGRTYTYIGINYEKVINESYKNANDRIPLFAIRFAISNPMAISNSLMHINKILGEDAIYSITGIDDIVINYKDLCVENVIKLFKEWYSTETAAVDNLLNIFSEITTRVGVHYAYDDKSEQKTADGVLQKECAQLLQDVHGIQKQILYRSDRLGSPRDGWLKPILEISKTLLRMSRTVVLDEFVYLLFPGIKVFLKNVLEMQKNNIQINEDPDITKKCNELVEQCSHLLEQIMRAEGQLSNQPELRPIEYDIPVFLLEYILAFLNGVVDLLQNDDDTIHAKIKFLIVPRLCENISAMEIFRADGNAKTPGLVLLNVPIKALYTPDSILLALCHETAHYAGEKNRLRDLRQKKYICASAVIIANRLFDSMNAALIEQIEDSITDTISQVEIRCIDDLFSQICVYVENLALNDNHYASFVWENIGKSCTQGDMRLLSPQRRSMEIVIIQELLYDFRTIFREVYADLCMLRILNLDPSSYVNALIDESYKNYPEGKEEKVLQSAIRIYAVLEARKQFEKGKNIQPQSRYISVWKRCYKIMKSLHQEIEEDKDGANNWIIPSSCVEAILQYARECYKSLLDLDSGLVLKLQEIYTNTKYGMTDYTEALRVIGESRNGAISVDG